MRSRFPHCSRSRGSPRGGAPGGSRGLTLVDVCVVLVVAAFVLGWLAPRVSQRSREQANRVKCASNLRQIGQGLQMYANENKGNFPRALYDGVGGTPTEYTAPDAPDPLAPGGPGPNDVTAAFYLLLRTQDLTSEVFICPTSPGERFDPRGKPLTAFSNFPDGRYLTYSYVNPYPTKAAVKDGFKLNYTLTSDFAIAADINPGGSGPASVTPQSPRRQMSVANSGNHNGDGQNVLYADGHVEFQNTPFCGMPRGAGAAAFRDNVYTCGAGYGAGPGGAGVAVNGAPVDKLDSVLLPVSLFGPAGTAGPPPTPSLSHYAVMGGAVKFAVIVLAATLVRRSVKPDAEQPD